MSTRRDFIKAGVATAASVVVAAIPEKRDPLKEELIRRGLIAPPPVHLTPRQQQEMERCKADPIHFIRAHAWTFDPFLRFGEPYIKFNPFPFQEDFISWLQERHKTQTDGMVEKSRDSGASYLVLYYFLHQWLFTEGFSGGIGSNKLEGVDNLGDPKSLFEKLRIAIRRLPEWMLPPGFAMKRNCGLAKLVNPHNRSIITGEGGDQIGRGGRNSLYLVDEAAFLDHPDMVDASLFQTALVRIYVSTPNGRNGFHRKRGRMKSFRMYWKDDPRKNKWEAKSKKTGELVATGQGHALEYEDQPQIEVKWPWFEIQKARESQNTVAQEIEISYIGSGNPCFDNYYLQVLYEELIAKEFSHRLLFEEDGKCEWGGSVSTYKDPESNTSYIIVADVAEGLSQDGEHDYSVAHIYNLHTWEQVLHYRGRPDTHIFAEDLANLALMYNNALVAVERNGPGLSVLNSLMNHCGYPNVYYHQEFDDNGMALTSMKPGWPSTIRNKKETVNDLDAIIRDMAKGELGFIWNDPNVIDELMSFVKMPGAKTGADSGSFDDSVTCCRIAAVLVPMYSKRRKFSYRDYDRKSFVPRLSGNSHLVR